MNLYEMDVEIRDAVDKGYNLAFVDGEGEFHQDDFNLWLETLKAERKAKVESIAVYIKDLIAEADALRNEEKVLAKRREKKLNKADRLKTFLTGFLQQSEYYQKHPFDTPKCQIRFRKSVALEVTDQKILDGWLDDHDEFLNYAKPTLNKVELKKYLANHEIPGAALVERQNIQIK